MLQITIPATEYFNSETNEFVNIKEQTLQLEHSLVSISKWESKWCKPFLDTNTKRTYEENLDYIKCMTITQNVNPDVYKGLTSENLTAITDYIGAPMTATTIKEKKGRGHQIITSELIYYWMFSLNIPMECQKWHINRLMMLIRVCNEKSQPPKKMSKSEILSRNRSLNAARKARLKSRG